MSMRTQSIISDPEPLTPPKIPKTTTAPKSEEEQLIASGNWPKLNEYIEQRKAFYQRYLPSAQPIETLSPEERVNAWNSAVTIIKELEDFQIRINTFKQK